MTLKEDCKLQDEDIGHWGIQNQDLGLIDNSVRVEMQVHETEKENIHLVIVIADFTAHERARVNKLLPLASMLLGHDVHVAVGLDWTKARCFAQRNIGQIRDYLQNAKRDFGMKSYQTTASFLLSISVLNLFAFMHAFTGKAV